MEALTEYFTLVELMASDTAKRGGIDNRLSATIVRNLQRIVHTPEQIGLVAASNPPRRQVSTAAFDGSRTICEENL